ncbi:MAG: hypothetical protein JSR74_11240 [Proteobacteria bacterium]|nr:hypothetical protein [Pseudomonadota bacterium]
MRERSSAGAAPFFDFRRFAWSETLERSHSVIRAAVDRMFARPNALLPPHEISVKQKPLGNDDQWKAFFLLASGHYFP